MNKRITHVIFTVATVATFSVINSLNPLNFGTITAYASSYELTDLEMQPSGGGDINLYENDNYTKELDNSKELKKTYYAKVSSDRSKVVFNTSGFDGTVKIFKDHSSKVYNDGDPISVFSGKTTFYIRLYDVYDENKPTNCKQEYKVIVKKYTSEEEKEMSDDTQGDIYLKTIELDYGDTPLNFDREKSTYDVNVGADVKSIAIKAEPDDGATTVKINNLTVDENDGYKKMVNLDPGDNKIEISLSQEYEEKRTYTLNINRGATTANASNNVSATTNTNGKTASSGDANSTQTANNGSTNNNNENNDINTKALNKWIKVGDKWKYNDGFGNPIKNTWYYDSTYGRTYYFDSNGNMFTGWLNLNNNWYFLNSNGAMETGWKQLGYNWYYLDYDGKMKTGWFEDSDGKYYYLYESNGAMAHDTTINGYKLGSNGAWIK
ncbi:MULTISPECIES: cadherin-like beta sandwich domain-containing protein [unclassified Clostridium]|uniref:cadherin-like beta sandwich domain-containing protein n=1 Tax=unclassified Clostridium TaxID=2614128 RepID=UPI000297F46F|nr:MULTISPECIES: cadherin-like beta sandwich domain-containing protein [unclassified Clostridium]EKQ50546.1 MAG: putative cell wall binding protein [Clostridium sp. Maddingley MBC34-26]